MSSLWPIIQINEIKSESFKNDYILKGTVTMAVPFLMIYRLPINNTPLKESELILF